MQRRRLRPVRAVEIIGVLFDLVVVRHQSLVVDAVAVAFRPTVGGEIEHRPDVVPPDAGVPHQLQEIVVQPIGLVLLGMPRSGRRDACRRIPVLTNAPADAVLAHPEDAPVVRREHLVEHLAHRLLRIPARIAVVGELVRDVVHEAGLGLVRRRNDGPRRVKRTDEVPCPRQQGDRLSRIELPALPRHLQLVAD